MDLFEACEFSWCSFTALFHFFYETEPLARVDLVEEHLEEDLVDVLDWVGGDVGGEIEDLGERDRFEVEGWLGAAGVEVDADEVSEEDEVESAGSLKKLYICFVLIEEKNLLFV